MAFAFYALLGWLFPSLKYVYFFALLSWLGSWIILGYCPLTKWEFLLRRHYDPLVDVNHEIIRYRLKKHLNVEVSHARVLLAGGVVWVTLLTLALLNFY